MWYYFDRKKKEKKKYLFVPTDKTYSILQWPCHE